MRIRKQGEIAKCFYGGAVTVTTLDKKVDYLMHAKTVRWEQMGAGKYGPMKAMMLRRLKFKGPKMEAMGNMGPFKNFLLLAGTVPSGNRIGSRSQRPVGTLDAETPARLGC